MKIIIVLLGVMLAAVVVLAGCGTGQAVKTTNGIYKGDLVLLENLLVAGGITTGFEVLEYKGADVSNVDIPKLKFKQLSTGDTLEYKIIDSKVTVKLGGKSYIFNLVKPTQMDSPLQTDFNGDGIIEVEHQLGRVHYR